MKKSKALKALLVFGMSIATATSLATATACNPDETNPTHTHTYEWATSDTQHWKECKEDHAIDPANPKTGHVYDQTGDKCVCGKEKPSEPPTHEHTWTWVNTDPDQHWKECNVAGHEGDKKDSATEGAHVYDQTGDKCVCGKEKPEDAHTHDYQWVNTEKNEHWKECDEDAEEEAGTRGAHVDANHDNVCDDCDYNGGALPEAYTTLLGKYGTEYVVADTFLQTRALAEFSAWGTAGIYTSRSGSGAITDNYSEVKDGKAVMVDNGGEATQTVVDFGGALGTIEGYFEISLESAANSWTPVQFFSAENKEFFALRTDGGNIKYRLNGGSPVVPASTVATADLTVYKVYFKYDYSTRKFSMTIDGNAFAEVDVIIDGIAGVKFVSSNSNSRLINLDNLVVVNTPIPFVKYKSELDAKMTGMLPPAGYVYVSAEAKTQADAAIAAYNTASETVTNNAEIKAAFDAFEAAYVSVCKLEYKANILKFYPATDYTVNKEAYDAAIADLDAALEKCTKLADFEKALEDVSEALEAIENDTQAAIADITVEVKNADGEKVGFVTVKAGETVTAEDLAAEIKAPSGKRIEGFYNESGCTTAAALPIDTTGEAQDKTITIYVKFEDIPSSEIVTHTLEIAEKNTTYSTDTQVGDFFTILAGSKGVKIEGAKMDTDHYDRHISLTSGKATTDAYAIKFTVTKSSVVTVVAGEKSDKTVTLAVLNDKGEAATVSDITKGDAAIDKFDTLPTDVAATYTFRLEAGTYYLGGSGGGAYIFALSVAEGA